MKTIYLYSPDTGELVGSQPARESPKEKGVYLIPAYATDIEPPTIRAKQVAIFSNGNWMIQPDYRGVYWDGAGNQVSIDRIGVLPDASYSSTKPEKKLPDIKTKRRRYILDRANERILFGVTSNVTGKNLYYPMDGMLVNAFLLTLTQAGAKQKKGEPYKVLCFDNGTPVIAEHTYDQLQVINDQMVLDNVAIFGRLITKFSAIDAALSETEIDNILW